MTATQPIGKRAHLTGGTKPAETAPLERQPLFGRGGLGERRFSQRSGLFPSVSHSLAVLYHFFICFLSLVNSLAASR